MDTLRRIMVTAVGFAIIVLADSTVSRAAIVVKHYNASQDLWQTATNITIDNTNKTIQFNSVVDQGQYWIYAGSGYGDNFSPTDINKIFPISSNPSLSNASFSILICAPFNSSGSIPYDNKPGAHHIGIDSNSDVISDGGIQLGETQGYIKRNSRISGDCGHIKLDGFAAAPSGTIGMIVSGNLRGDWVLDMFEGTYGLHVGGSITGTITIPGVSLGPITCDGDITGNITIYNMGGNLCAANLPAQKATILQDVHFTQTVSYLGTATYYRVSRDSHLLLVEVNG